MHRIDTPTAQVDKFGAGKNGFTRGNPQTGVPATALDDDYFDAVQEELAGVIEGAGIALNKDNRTQLLAALKKLFLQSGNNLFEIKTAGAAAIAATLSNLGLSDVAHLPQLTGVVGTSRNAKMSVTTASATATFTADELIVQTELGGRQYKLTSFNKTINLATTGAGGMDTGTAPVSGWVAIYAIYNPTNQASALLAVNATTVAAPEVYGGVNMPAGYTASALVSVWKTTAVSLFYLGAQRDRHVDILRQAGIITSTQQTSYIQAAVAEQIPRNAKMVYGDMQISAASTSAGIIYGISPYTNSVGSFSFAEAGGTGYQTPFCISIFTNQTISYQFTVSTGTATLGIFFSGYNF